MCHKGIFLLLSILLFFPLFSFFMSCSREASSGQSALGGAGTLAWCPHSCSPLGVLLPQHGSPMAAVPPAWSVFPATLPVLCVPPPVDGTGTLKLLLNLPEVFLGAELFMLVSEVPVAISGLSATQGTSATFFYQISAVAAHYAPVSADFCSLVLKF